MRKSFFAATALTLTFVALTGVASFSLPNRHSVWTGQTITTKNGAKITALGSKLTIATADGKSTVIDRADPAFANPTMPVAVPMASCAKLLNFIQLYPATDITWRRAVVAYMNRC